MQKRRILIIEDNIDAADSLREVLEFFGHEVHVAYSGDSGVEQAETIQPEIVLCDIGLPGMDGYQVARALRAEKRAAAAYLVALSGYALPEDRKRAMEAGFDHHIAKPPNIDRLQEILGRA